jgi:hypothetical protein
MHFLHLIDFILQLFNLLLSFIIDRCELQLLLWVDSLNLADDVFRFLVVGVRTGYSPHEGENQGDQAHDCRLFFASLVDTRLEFLFGLVKQLQEL